MSPRSLGMDDTRKSCTYTQWVGGGVERGMDYEDIEDFWAVDENRKFRSTRTSNHHIKSSETFKSCERFVCVFKWIGVTIKLDGVHVKGDILDIFGLYVNFKVNFLPDPLVTL